MSIRIFYDGIKPVVKKRRNLLEFIEKVIREERKIPGDLYFIFTDDEYLLSVNKEFLGHNYYTDVITFGGNDGKKINGEIYLSIDTIKVNASRYRVKLEEEIARVMIHGILHLCGYEDKGKEERKIMKKLEDKYLEWFKHDVNDF